MSAFLLESIRFSFYLIAVLYPDCSSLIYHVRTIFTSDNLYCKRNVIDLSKENKNKRRVTISNYFARDSLRDNVKKWFYYSPLPPPVIDIIEGLVSGVSGGFTIIALSKSWQLLNTVISHLPLSESFHSPF